MPTHRKTADNGSGNENREQILRVDISQTHLPSIFWRIFGPTTNAAVGNKPTWNRPPPNLLRTRPPLNRNRDMQYNGYASAHPSSLFASSRTPPPGAATYYGQAAAAAAYGSQAQVAALRQHRQQQQQYDLELVQQQQQQLQQQQRRVGVAALQQHLPAAAGVFAMNGLADGQGQTKTDEDKMTDLVYSLYTPEKREAALLELSKRREQYDSLALVLWNSFGVSSDCLAQSR